MFIRGRKLADVVEGVSSVRSDVTTGVSDGTVLGPILFLIHMEDIDGELRYATASSFADDTRLVMKLRSTNNILLG